MEDTWTRQQWAVIITLCVTHLCNGMCVSLQAPFYPAEAEKKGATATEYGLVFGIFELTVFLVSPIIGKCLPRIGIRKAFSGGITITGIMCVLFGLLNRIDDSKTFITLSFVIRIVEALGNSAFLASSFTLVAQLFQVSVGTVFALVETSFGLGMIIGPTIGGALYEAGGYTLPFGVLGGLLLLQALLSNWTLPYLKEQKNNSEDEESQNFGLLKALSIPSVVLAIFSVFSSSIAVGALQATLEPHLSQFHLSPMHVGFFFMLYGGAYALVNPFWGWMADRFSPKVVILIGSFLLSLGFFLVGPVPVFGLKSSYELCILSVIIAGVGLGAQLVASFSLAQKSAVAKGFPDGISTYALVSSIWTSSFALGAFVGPTAAGAMYDLVGFEWSTLFTVGWNVAVFLLTFLHLVLSRVNRKRNGEIAGLYKTLEENTSDYGSLKQQDGSRESLLNTGDCDKLTTEVEDIFNHNDRYQTL